MSHTLRNAAESTAHALTDLVEGAREKIEELPPIARSRRQHRSKGWLALAVAGVAGLLIVLAKRRLGSGSEPADGDTDSVGARMAERSLAVS